GSIACPMLPKPKMMSLRSMRACLVSTVISCLQETDEPKDAPHNPNSHPGRRDQVGTNSPVDREASVSKETKDPAHCKYIHPSHLWETRHQASPAFDVG